MASALARLVQHVRHSLRFKGEEDEVTALVDGVASEIFAADDVPVRLVFGIHVFFDFLGNLVRNRPTIA